MWIFEKEDSGMWKYKTTAIHCLYMQPTRDAMNVKSKDITHIMRS
jgi:hypothetical protein